MQLQTNLKQQRSIEEEFTSLEVVYEEEHQLAWYRMNAHPRPCFTSRLIKDIQSNFLATIENNTNSIKHIVMSSNTKGVFNLGGDLELFKRLILERDRDQLLEYALKSIEPLYQFHVGLGMEITTISLVQGDALGAGFEAAISGDLLIAERSAKMGLPEVLFNMFPGMGAYSFLSRKVNSQLADKMILEGKLYSAEELYDLGVVDILVEDGEGEKAVYAYLKKQARSINTYKAVRKAKKCISTVTFEELAEIASIWVDANMNLGQRDLRMMERLVKRQTAKYTIV
ncbi:crotonase/enoyl-CoA hydratase family protein [bacterium AH-315-I20]|nr:crotonase/enoyl-CoA hydratase family protein [bacterium AH-315-I20]